MLLLDMLAAGPAIAADFSPVERILTQAIRDKAFPGCAVVIGTDRAVLFKRPFGSFDYEGGPAVTTRSLYDLASLTKVVGTTSVTLALVRDGKLRLRDPVCRYIPEFRGGGREAVTVEHLLTHSSGLPAWKPFYKEAKGYDAVLRLVVNTPLENPPGTKTVYSDLGLMLMGEVDARSGGRPLAELEQELVFKPLGMKDTTRRPLSKGIERVVPTEKLAPDPAPQGTPAGRAPPAKAIRGVVHDENSAAAEGLTGHAGLFSTADDLAILARELLRGYQGKSKVFPRRLLRRFTARRGLVKGSSRALGWDTPTGTSSAGTMLSPHAFGHTGFTGTSLWVDPEKNLFILLLTNRVHPTRKNLKILAVRKHLADATVLCLRKRIRSF